VFVLAHDTVAADPAAVRGWLLMLHGIYGSGANWRSVARKLTDRRPEWGAVLVDLRMHGDSQDAPPPHTLEAAAGDLDAVAAAVPGPVRAVCGHSFGGKVALRYRAGAPDSLLQTWMLDASPSARPGAMDEPDNTVAAVLRMLEELPERFADRDQLVAEVTGRGWPRMLGNWLAMNLEPEGEGMRMRLDTGAMRALLASYYELDLWPAVEDPGAPGELRVVIAGDSTAVSADDRERFAEVETASGGRVRAHLLEGLGHWLHVEAPDRVIDLLAGELPEI
jgi:esterase